MKLPDFISKKYLTMIWELALAQFRMKDQGTLLGFLWTLIHPLIYFFVLYGLFKNWMRSIPSFPLYLIIGIVQWNFFVSGTLSCINVIKNNSAYIKSINFPKATLVMSSVLAVVFSYLLELVVLVVFWFLIKQKIGLALLGILPLIPLLVYLVVSVSLVLATVGLYFLDIERIWGILASVGLFLTPIFYSLDMLSPAKRKIILLNPMTHIIMAFRAILIDNKLPQMSGLAYVFGLSTVVFFLGYKLFRRNEGYFIEKI